MSYTPPVGTLDATWSGAGIYLAPRVRVLGWWAGLDNNAFPLGHYSLEVGRPFVAHRWAGWDSLAPGVPRVTHDWEYRPPYAELQVSWSGATAYIPPVGSISAQWVKGTGPAVEQYVTPAGVLSGAVGTPAVRMNQYAFPAGWSSGAFGAAKVESYFIQHASWQGAASYSFPRVVAPGWWKAPDVPTLLPAGLRATQWGTAFVQNADNYPQTLYPFGQRMTQWGDFTTSQTGEFPVSPVGWQLSAYGQPTIYNRDQYLLAFNEGARYTAFGTHKVHIPEDQPAAPTGLEVTQFGTALVAWEVRWIEHGNAYAGPMLGVAHIRHRTQTISVPWTVFTQYGTPLVGRHAELAAGGGDFLLIPTTHRVKHDNVLVPAGFTTPDRWGWPWVSRSPRVLGHQQRDESLTFGEAHAQLWVRYLQHSGFQWEREGTKWGSFAHVFNRNRTITVPGLQSFRSQPLHLVENAARALVPAGIAPAGFGPDTFIADRERFVATPGFDSFRMSNFGNRIHNAASLLRLQGRDSLAVSTQAKVESNLQTVRTHSGSNPEFGEVFVADAVRVVAQWPSLNALHRVGTPRISNLEQYAAPAGIAAPAPGFPVLLGPFLRTLQPRWIVRTRHGMPAVRNKTPNVYAWGRSHTEFSGAAWVSFMRRPLAPAGIEPPDAARPAVQFRTRTVRPVGSLMFGNSTWATQVKNLMPDPPSTRTIAPTGFSPQAPKFNFGDAEVRFNSVYPPGLDSFRPGGSVVRLQGAILRTYFPYTEWGTPTLLGLRQYVAPESIPDPSREAGEFGKPRLSPHTIWATVDTPDQASLNHPGERFYPISAREPVGFAQSTFPWFGETVISNRVRALRPLHTSALMGVKFGDATVRLRRRLVSPLGLPASQWGIATMLPHTKRSWAISWLSAEFGATEVRKTFDDLRPHGDAFLEVGEATVANWVRDVAPSGFSATQWGNNAPMVHFPRRFTIGGDDATQWGVTWASHRMRSVVTAGAVMTEMDWVTFNDRMTVAERYRLTGSGLDGLELGRPAIANAQQFIRPYMIPPPCLRCNGAKVQHG